MGEIMSLKDHYKKLRFFFIHSRMKKDLKNKDFTIISNNCWGGHVYQDLGIEYKSPFVGMFLYSDCYLKLLNNLHYYLKQDIEFVKESKYPRANEQRKNKYFPIARLDDIEIHMLHYNTDEEALAKWNRRKSRMDLNNLFIKMHAPDNIDEEKIRQFDALPFKHKVIFTEKVYNDIPSAVHIKGMNTKIEMNKYMKYFDVVHWLNKGEINRC